MTESDGTTKAKIRIRVDVRVDRANLPVDVDLRRVNAKNLLNNSDDNREGLVDLE